MIKKHPNHFYIVGYSGGKDSDLTLFIWNEALKQINFNVEYVINFANTSNDTADTYRKAKQLPTDKRRFLNPKVGFYQWVTKVKNYKIPTILTRNCCSTYKEGQIYSEYDTSRPTIQVLGVRKYESSKRSKYKAVMDSNYFMSILGKNSMPKAWIMFAPVVEWTDEDVWLWLLRDKIDFNQQYKYGFNRCGCLVCPYSSDYVDLLIEEYYPTIWKRWVNVLTKTYEVNRVERNFKWTLSEYLNGAWKTGKSKEQMLIQLAPTPERVAEVAAIKGISITMARKYFRRKCCECGKALNPSEIAMFYKLNGRYEDVLEDTREIQCKKCYCNAVGMKPKEYIAMAYRFTDDGCNLF